MNRHDFILSPVLTEKSTFLREKGNQYSFFVRTDINKLEVKRSIEETLNVKVASVRMMVAKGKLKRVNRFVGKRPDRKKAIVTLKEGETLKIFEG